jgi:hypothetical protein
VAYDNPKCKKTYVGFAGMSGVRGEGFEPSKRYAANRTGFSQVIWPLSGGYAWPVPDVAKMKAQLLSSVLV